MAHGETLTATAASYSSLQWYADASPIVGETALTYVVDRADVTIGPDITCRATGSGGSADSNALSYYPTQDYRDVWDAAYGVTLVGSDVDSWESAGVGANTLTAAASSNRPAFTASDADFSGEPSVVFDGALEYLRKASMSMGGSLSCFVTGGVLRVDSGVVNNDRIADYNSTHLLRVSVGAGSPYVSATSNSVATTDIRAASRCVVGAAQYGVTQSIYVSGVAEDTDANVTSGPADSLPFAVGGSTTGTLTAPFKTPLYVLGVSSGSASARAILDLNAYSSWRFGTP